jgi:hypothetical protein
MHTNGNSMNVNPASFYSSANAEAAAAQRAEAVRKRLLKSAAALDGTTPEDEAQLVNRWLGVNQPESDGHSAAGKDFA